MRLGRAQRIQIAASIIAIFEVGQRNAAAGHGDEWKILASAQIDEVGQVRVLIHVFPFQES